MAFVQGNMTFTRYHLHAARPKQKITMSDLNASLERWKAQPLELQGRSRELEAGWACPFEERIAEGSAYWDLSNAEIDTNKFYLKIRYDRRRVCKELQAYQTRQLINKYVKKTGKQPTPAIRKEFLNEVKGDLLKKTLPEIKFRDVLWFFAESNIIFFGSVKSERILFEKLFQQAFGDPLGLSLLPFYSTVHGLFASEPDVADNMLAKLSQVLPTAWKESELTQEEYS